MTTHRINRRGFVAGLGSAAVLAASPRLGAAQNGSNIAVRQSIATLDDSYLEMLRTAVRVMQSRQASDPTSWTYQANIHGTYDMPLAQGWAQCQHGSFFFLSWHRMYLYYFERILRAACNQGMNFALPYWNYSDPAQRALPAAFRTPADASNPLFANPRDPQVNAGGEMPASAVDYSQAFSDVNFSSPGGSGDGFGGQSVSGPVHFDGPHGDLESQPHDVIHVLVGGDNGWMVDPNLAARDPIFWLHHANIDRLWNRWLSLGGGRSNPIDDVWMNTAFTFFDETGAPQTMTGAQIVSNESPPLNYRYDDDPPASTRLIARTAIMGVLRVQPEVRKPTLLTSSQPTHELGGTETAISVPLPQEAKTTVQGIALAVGTRPNAERLILTVDGVQFDKTPGVYYEVYVNLPEGAKPDPRSVYHVGNLSFFGLKPHDGRHAPGAAAQEPNIAARFNITAAVGELHRNQKLNADELRVTFVPRGVLPPKGQQPKAVLTQHKVRFARLSIRKE
jgi:tyrosinase